MEIYTGDFISIAQEYADKIKKELKSENYIIEDVCCDLQMKIRRLIYKRLSEQFKEIIKDDLVYIENREYLYNKLTKTINELWKYTQKIEDFLNENIKSEPSIFTHMIYRLPTKSEIEEVNSYNLTSDKIISGFGYTIIGRGIRSMENKKMIYDSIKMLVDMYPDNTEYNKALNKIKQDYDL